MKMSGGVVAWVVCSFRPWLAVDSRLKPRHLLPQNCHLQQSSWSCIERKSRLSNLHLLTRKGSVGFLHILPQADVLLLEESCSQSDLIFLQPSRLSWSLATAVTQNILQVKIKQMSHLLAAIVFLVLDSQYLSSFFSAETNCLALFLMIGCGRSSSMSKARSLGSKSAPGTVARARSCKVFFGEK